VAGRPPDAGGSVEAAEERTHEAALASEAALTGEAALQPRRDDALWQAGVLLGLLWLVMVAGGVRPYTFEFDSANYTLGVLHYDVANHQPHPPGYPLWILAAKGLTWFVGDPRVAQILLAALFVAAALACFFLLARKRLGSWGALVAAGCLAFAPPVLLYSSVQATYAVDLLASCLLGWLVAAVLEGDDSRIVPALAAAAVLAGFRQSAAAFLAPILLAAVVATLRRRAYRKLGTGMAAASLLGAAWFLPTARLIGGVARWKQLNQSMWLSGVPSTSIVYGAPWLTYKNMVESFFAHLALAMAAIGLCMLVWRVLAIGRAEGPASEACPCWDSWWFYLLWVTPCLLVDLLFHYPKPGYMLLILPPFFLIAAKIVQHAVVLRTEASARKRAYFLTVTGAAAFSLVLGYAPLPDSSHYGQPWASILNWTFLARPAFARLIAQGHEDLKNVLEDNPDGDAVLVFTLMWFPPEFRTLGVDFPHLHIAAELGPDPRLQLFRGPVPQPGTILPTSLRTIYWIGQNFAVKEVRQIFPQTVFVLRNRLYTVWRTDLPGDPVDETLTLNGVRIRLRRAANPAIVLPWQQTRAPRAGLGHGFSGLEPGENGYCVWALGPAATVNVEFPPGWKDPVKLQFRVLAMFPGTAATLLVNGKPDRTINRFSSEEPIDVVVPPANPSEVTFQFERWNGHPQVMAPQDPRPMAVMFRRIRLESGGESLELLDR
jgi:hypothetical protein